MVADFGTVPRLVGIPDFLVSVVEVEIQRLLHRVDDRHEFGSRQFGGLSHGAVPDLVGGLVARWIAGDAPRGLADFRGGPLVDSAVSRVETAAGGPVT